MPDIVIAEFMDDDAVADLTRTHDTHYDPSLVDKPDELLRLAAGARGLVVRNRTQVRGALLDACTRLLVVGRLGVGLDNIDVEACKARGVAVCPATGANDVSVAEWVIAAAMILLRGAYAASDDVASGRWPRNALIGREVSGKVIGLVGFGSIAREVARRAAALGMSCIAYDPFLKDADPAWALARQHGLEPLLREADAVSLHVPLTAETRHMIDGLRLARMKPGAILLNAARGGVVDEAALVEALKSRHLGGAALDVFEDEPVSADRGVLFAGVPNLLLTPHIAGVTLESNVRVSWLTVENVRKHLAAA